VSRPTPGPHGDSHQTRHRAAWSRPTVCKMPPVPHQRQTAIPSGPLRFSASSAIRKWRLPNALLQPATPSQAPTRSLSEGRRGGEEGKGPFGKRITDHTDDTDSETPIRVIRAIRGHNRRHGECASGLAIPNVECRDVTPAPLSPVLNRCDPPDGGRTALLPG